MRGGDSQTPPVWLNAPPPPEPTPPRPLIPSRATDDDSDPPLASPLSAAAGAYGFARGRIIHRLLQNLPDIAEDKRDEAAARFLANPQHRLAPERQTEIRREVMALLRHPDYARLFAHPSRAEVPLVGRIGDRLVAGQVDRLCVRETEVWIVDYKTNRPPPQSSSGVADIYLRQLSAYRAVLREIYPDKTVRCFLLWTYEPRLMPIPDDLL